MIRLIICTAFVLGLSIGCGLATSDAADESAEPALKYTVKIGEKTVTVSEGETVQLDGTFNDPKIAVTPEPYRVFPYQGITFKYPRSFVFEAELDDQDSKMWTLSGNDFKIMYFVLNTSVSTADYANTMIDQFGRENAKVVNEKATISLGKQRLSGTSLHISIAAYEMVMDIYRIPSEGAETRLLVFQDSLDDSGKRSKEGEQTLELIRSSFALEK